MANQNKDALHRDAKTGEFTTKAHVERDPSGTTTEARDGGSTGGAHRSAETGRFVDEKTAERVPEKTIRDA